MPSPSTTSLRQRQVPSLVQQSGSSPPTPQPQAAIIDGQPAGDGDSDELGRASSEPARTRSPTRLQRARAQTKAYVHKAGAKVRQSLDILDQKLEEFEDGADGPVKRMLDTAMKKSIEKVLSKMGTATRQMMKPAYMPERACKMMDSAHDAIWPEVQATLQASILEGQVSARDLRGVHACMPAGRQGGRQGGVT